MDYDQVSSLWREGERRLATADPSNREILERVAREIVAELHRRLGGPFTTQELAALYAAGGPDWFFDLPPGVAPAEPAAWDMTTVAGAAFARYARQAADYRADHAVARPPGMEPG